MSRLLVAPGEPANLAGRDTAWSGGPEFEKLTAKELDATAKGIRSEGVSELADAQELLWASDRYALLPPRNDQAELRRTIRSSRLPSSLLTSRTLILLASSPPRQKTFI